MIKRTYIKASIAALYILLPFFMMAQEPVDVAWGPEYEYGRQTRMIDFLGTDEEGFFVLRNQRSGYMLEKYSKKELKLLQASPFELPEVEGTDFTLLDIFRIDGKMLVFSNWRNKKERTYRIYAQALSDEGVLSTDYTMLEEVVYDERKEEVTFHIKLSPDSTKFLLYSNHYYDKNSNEQFSYKVYDNKLNELWKKSFELPYRDVVMGVSNVRLGNEGNIYMKAKIVPDRKKGEKKERGIQNTKYNIFAYYPESGALKQYEISLGATKWVSDMNYTINTEGNVLVTGFYSLKNAYTMDGTFFLKINKDTKAIEAKNLKAFDKDFLLNFMKERKADKNSSELGVFDLRTPVLRDDGGLLQIAEFYTMYVTTFVDQNGNQRTTYHYVYNDVIVINIDPDGTIDWISVVPKKQNTTNDGGYYSSYALSVNEDKLHFIFNDHPKNLVIYEKDPLKLKSMINPKGAVTMLSTVDSDGNMRRSALFKAKDLKTVLRPKFHYELDHGKMIIFGVRRSKYKFGKIDFTKN